MKAKRIFKSYKDLNFLKDLNKILCHVRFFCLFKKTFKNIIHKKTNKIKQTSECEKKK